MQLWFAWNSLPLRGKATVFTSLVRTSSSCDLLEIRYLWEVKQQSRGGALNSAFPLWFAWNSLPLRGKATVNAASTTLYYPLWFAWNSLPLRGKATVLVNNTTYPIGCDLLEIRYLWEVKQQCAAYIVSSRIGCDLLEIRYLWEVKQQWFIACELSHHVVICLKFVTFER